MNLDTLMLYTEEVEANTRAVKEGVMLTMLDPSGRNNKQHPIESVTLEEGCVVISLLNVEDATWYDQPHFDEEITAWVRDEFLPR